MTQQAKSEGEAEARRDSRGDSALIQTQQERKSPSPAFPSSQALASEHTFDVLVASCGGIIPEELLPPAKHSRLEFASPFFGYRLLAHPGDEVLYWHGSSLQAFDQQSLEQTCPLRDLNERLGALKRLATAFLCGPAQPRSTTHPRWTQPSAPDIAYIGSPIHVIDPVKCQ